MKTNAQQLSALSMVALFFSLSLPSFVSAQVATTTDGSYDSTSTRTQYIRGWRGQNSEVQNKINALPSTVTTSVFMPVLFGVEPSNLRSDFGDARSNGRTHLGNDIMAVKGTPIVSPTEAIVLRIGVGAGEGNYVYTANPGGETFVYMHLDTFGEGVAAGTVLAKGSLIGYVGNTGNASGGASHLHFEIHDSNGLAVDPYPRLTGIFSLQEKILYLNNILNINSDKNTLAQILVANFRSTFNQATSLGIALPEIIRNFMVSLPVTPPQPGSRLPAGDLELGDKGNGVVVLQNYLIARRTGPFATRLSQAGATGNFGPMTQSALIEYQHSVGISPADGYYGGATRARIEASAVVTIPVVPSQPSPSSGATTLTRDLSLNSVGEDVRSLQRFLNSHGYLVSTGGAGAPGYETTFFGSATKAAVIKYQMSKGITPAAGYVGPITRQSITSTI